MSRNRYGTNVYTQYIREENMWNVFAKNINNYLMKTWNKYLALPKMTCRWCWQSYSIRTDKENIGWIGFQMINQTWCWQCRSKRPKGSGVALCKNWMKVHAGSRQIRWSHYIVLCQISNEVKKAKTKSSEWQKEPWKTDVTVRGNTPPSQ